MLQEFTLVIAGNPVTEGQVEALFEAGLDDGTVSTSCGVSRVAVDREAESLEFAVRSAIAQVNAAGLAVERVEIAAGQFVPQGAT
jgi:hypothetical protein